MTLTPEFKFCWKTKISNTLKAWCLVIVVLLLGGLGLLYNAKKKFDRWMNGKD